MKFKRNGVFLAGLLVVALALVAAGCGGDDGGEAPEALPSSSCTAIEYEGDGDPDYIIASDLPLQGVVAHPDAADQRRDPLRARTA